MRRLTIACTAALLFTAPAVLLPAVPAAAQAASTKALARELVELTFVKSGVYQGIAEPLHNMLGRHFAVLVEKELGRNLTEAESATVQRITRKLVGQFMSAEILSDISADIMTRLFSEAEIRTVLQFQKSPVGTKWRDATPRMMAESQAAMRAHFQAHQTEFQEAIAAEFEREFPDLPKRPR